MYVEVPLRIRHETDQRSAEVSQRTYIHPSVTFLKYMDIVRLKKIAPAADVFYLG